MPAGWTDVAAPDPFVVIAAGRWPFTTDGLLAVADLARTAAPAGTAPHQPSAAVPDWSPAPGYHHKPPAAPRTAPPPRRLGARSYPAPAAAGAGRAPAPPPQPPGTPGCSRTPSAAATTPGHLCRIARRGQLGQPRPVGEPARHRPAPPARPAGSCPPRPAPSPSPAGAPPAGPPPRAPARPGQQSWVRTAGSHARHGPRFPPRTPPRPYHNRRPHMPYRPTVQTATPSGHDGRVDTITAS